MPMRQRKEREKIPASARMPGMLASYLVNLEPLIGNNLNPRVWTASGIHGEKEITGLRESGKGSLRPSYRCRPNDSLPSPPRPIVRGGHVPLRNRRNLPRVVQVTSS